jgi:hypothetical protein
MAAFCSLIFVVRHMEKAKANKNWSTTGSAITVVEAGRRGGLTLLARRGRSWFAQIGSKGQQVLRNKYPGMAREWGKWGGRPRKPNLPGLRGAGN